jgi:hypothetical protein
MNILSYQTSLSPLVHHSRRSYIGGPEMEIIAILLPFFPSSAKEGQKKCALMGCWRLLDGATIE